MQHPIFFFSKCALRNATSTGKWMKLKSKDPKNTAWKFYSVPRGHAFIPLLACEVYAWAIKIGHWVRDLPNELDSTACNCADTDIWEQHLVVFCNVLGAGWKTLLALHAYIHSMLTVLPTKGQIYTDIYYRETGKKSFWVSQTASSLPPGSLRSTCSAAWDMSESHFSF